MVIVLYQGRLGNNLFQYVAGRLLAGDRGCSLWAKPIPHFPDANAIPFVGIARLLRNPIVCEGHRLDWEVLRNTNRSIVMKGFFGRYEYYRERRHEILALFNRPILKELPEDVLTIHVRSGDIWSSGSNVIHPDYCALPLSYYEGIIREGNWSRIEVVSENPGDPIVAALVQRHNATFVSTGSAGEDFECLRASKNLVMAVSSFSWWAAFLSRARRIFFPVAGIFDPDHVQNRSSQARPNYVIDDDPRIQLKKVKAPLPWRGTEDQLRWLLEN